MNVKGISVMNEADCRPQSLDSGKRLEEKIDRLAAELVQIRQSLAILSSLPGKLAVEKLSVGQIDFHLENLNIHEVSGALNIGITSGLNLRRPALEKGPAPMKPQQPKAVKEEGLSGKPNKSVPACKIHFSNP